MAPDGGAALKVTVVWDRGLSSSILPSRLIRTQTHKAGTPLECEMLETHISTVAITMAGDHKRYFSSS